ncbi:hemin uptake protein HemP [Nostoc sp. 3335mG]|nr:hemin uptake protein HemP [Nostoc sp. 3335mG]
MPSNPPRLAVDPVKIVKSEELFSGRSEIQIEHQGMVYRLRVTRQDKLILTK